MSLLSKLSGLKTALGLRDVFVLSVCLDWVFLSAPLFRIFYICSLDLSRFYLAAQLLKLRFGLTRVLGLWP